MSIRDQLKQREEERSAPKGNGLNEGLPEGITRYVRTGGAKSEIPADGRQFVMLADPDSWYFYWTHEDGDFATRATYVKKHSCLYSPRAVGSDIKTFSRANPSACISCKAKAKRKLYFMIPVYDLEYGTWRVLDVKEYHALNLIGDYDKLEKAAKKFNKEYSLVGDVVTIKKTSDGKSFSLESCDGDVPEAAAEFVNFGVPYAELANFRDEADIIALLNEADPEHIDASVLNAAPAEPAIEITEDEIPF